MFVFWYRRTNESKYPPHCMNTFIYDQQPLRCVIHHWQGWAFKVASVKFTFSATQFLEDWQRWAFGCKSLSAEGNKESIYRWKMALKMGVAYYWAGALWKKTSKRWSWVRIKITLCFTLLSFPHTHTFQSLKYSPLHPLSQFLLVKYAADFLYSGS